MRRFLIIGIACFSIAAAAFFFGFFLFRVSIGPSIEKNSTEIAHWLQSQNLPPGTHSLALPPKLRGVAVNGMVDVYVRSDHVFSFLIKTRLTYKNGYEGYLYCSSPFQMSSDLDDLIVESYDDYDHGNYHKDMPVTPFVRARISDHLLEVFVHG